MTDAQVRAAIEKYRSFFASNRISAGEFPHAMRFHRDHDVRALALAHCHGMLNRLLAFLVDGPRERAMRWLGFVQGCLWMSLDVRRVLPSTTSRKTTDRASDACVAERRPAMSSGERTTSGDAEVAGPFRGCPTLAAEVRAAVAAASGDEAIGRRIVDHVLACAYCWKWMHARPFEFLDLEHADGHQPEPHVTEDHAST